MKAVKAVDDRLNALQIFTKLPKSRLYEIFKNAHNKID